jgi:hypothetical protein
MKIKYELPKSFDDGLQMAELVDKLGIKTTAGQIALRYALENVCLLDKKQLDYGSRNISDFGPLGVVVRINDKFQRLKTLLGKRRKPKNESIEDSFRDLSNYGIIGAMTHKGEWPNE